MKECVLTLLRENVFQNSADPGKEPGTRSGEKGCDIYILDLVKPRQRRGFTLPQGPSKWQESLTEG